MQKFKALGAEFAYSEIGEKCDDAPVFIWAHGWGQTHASFLPLIDPFATHGLHISLDMPGHGNASEPPEDWSTKEYADAIAAWIKEQKFPPVIWVGHSFGCRVGVQLAAHHPECISKMALIAGAGLKRKRPLPRRIYLYCRIKLFKLLKHLVPNGKLKDKLMTIFGSTDYKNAGVMRKVFVRVVNEDLSETAQNVKCPTTLIYGSNDDETPPEMGERYAKLIQNAKLHILEGQDHYTVLQNGRHPVIKILNDFLKDA